MSEIEFAWEELVMVFGSLRYRMASPLAGKLVSFSMALCAIALTVPVLVFSAGCGGGGDDSDNNLPSPGTSPGASPSATPSPAISPLPSASPSAPPSTPPLTGETLTVGQAVIGLSNVAAEANIPSDPVVFSNDGFAIGATNNKLGNNGSSAQVFFSDVKNGVVRGVTLVLADRTGATEGETATLGPVVTQVRDTKVAFVIFTAKPAADKDDARLRQWHSAGGGSVILEKLSGGQAKIRIIDAQMQPRTDVANNGQAGTFTLNGAGFATIQ